MAIPPSKSQALAQTQIEAHWRTYNKRVPGGLALLLSFSGSGIPRSLPFGVVAGVYALLLEKYAEIDGFDLFEHTYPFHVIAFITGFGLIFRRLQLVVLLAVVGGAGNLLEDLRGTHRHLHAVDAMKTYGRGIIQP